jgi:hypothetical protein
MGWRWFVGRTLSHPRAALYTFNLSSSGTIFGLPVYRSLRVLDYRFGTPTTGSVGDANNIFVLLPDPPEYSTEGSHSCNTLLDYDQFPSTDAA